MSEDEVQPECLSACAVASAFRQACVNSVQPESVSVPMRQDFFHAVAKSCANGNSS
jgi:hypothetical protein